MIPRGVQSRTGHSSERRPGLEALLHRLEEYGATAPGVKVRIATGPASEPFEYELPQEVVGLLREILAELAKGRTVTVVPSCRDLTSAEAAKFLGVSRPHLVSLLDAGRLPSYKVGTHRRVRRDDLLAFRENLDEARKNALDDLAAHDDELGINRG